MTNDQVKQWILDQSLNIFEDYYNLIERESPIKKEEERYAIVYAQYQR